MKKVQHNRMKVAATVGTKQEYVVVEVLVMMLAFTNSVAMIHSN